VARKTVSRGGREKHGVTATNPKGGDKERKTLKRDRQGSFGRINEIEEAEQSPPLTAEVVNQKEYDGHEGQK